MLDLDHGDLVLVKNRESGSLETPLVGPFRFIMYKDFDKYACILETDEGNTFDCSVSHIVPVDSDNVKRRNV